MEYRRRRKKAKNQRRRIRAPKRNSSAGSALISLLLIAGIVYLVVSSNAGTWIAKNVMAPLFTAASGWKQELTTPDGTAAPASQTPGQSAETPASLDLSGQAAEPVSAQASFPSMRCVMLQMGVYSSLENAQKEASALQAKGAGGYILKDNSTGTERYRVMAAGYATEEEARSVKERLEQEGIDSILYTVESPSATFKVTADENVIAGVQSGFAAFSTAQVALTDAAVSFDKDGMGMEAGKALAGNILARFEADMQSLSAYGGEGGAIGVILEAYTSARDQLIALSGGDYQSTVDFSAAMKYTQLYLTDQYATLIRELAQ